MRVQFIERNGRSEWAVLPYEEYLRLVEQAEMLEDIQDYDRIKNAVESVLRKFYPLRLFTPWLTVKTGLRCGENIAN